MATKTPLAYPERLRNPKEKSIKYEHEHKFLTALRFDINRRVSDNEEIMERSIYLYMPLSAKNSTPINWEQKGIGKIGQAIVDPQGVLNKIGNAEWSDGLDVGLGLASEQSDALSYRNQVAANPYLKMLFRGISMRSFEFQFKFTPRNVRESERILDIINEFREASLPGYSSGGLYFTYPKPISIAYLQYHDAGGQENRKRDRAGYFEIPWMNKFKASVITSLDVDYTSAGYYVPMRDGFPSETTLTMQFTENDVITRGDVAQGF